MIQADHIFEENHLLHPASKDKLGTYQETKTSQTIQARRCGYIHKNNLNQNAWHTHKLTPLHIQHHFRVTLFLLEIRNKTFIRCQATLKNNSVSCRPAG